MAKGGLAAAEVGVVARELANAQLQDSRLGLRKTQVKSFDLSGQELFDLSCGADCGNCELSPIAGRLLLWHNRGAVRRMGGRR